MIEFLVLFFVLVIAAIFLGPPLLIGVLAIMAVLNAGKNKTKGDGNG